MFVRAVPVASLLQEGRLSETRHVDGRRKFYIIPGVSPTPSHSKLCTTTTENSRDGPPEAFVDSQSEDREMIPRLLSGIILLLILEFFGKECKFILHIQTELIFTFHVLLECQFLNQTFSNLGL